MTKKDKLQVSWTKKEENFIKKFYKVKSATELANILKSRSQGAIRERLQKLGVKKKEFIEPNTFKLTKLDMGLFIGLLEGEGTIALNKSGRWIGPKIFIANTNRSIILKLKEILPFGRITSFKLKNGRPCYRFSFTNLKDTLAVAKTIKPHLISERKKMLARLLIIYCQERLSKLRKFHGFNIKLNSNKDTRTFNKMKQLNSSGGKLNDR